jgi:alkylation response protein AidB-like acyl-CoA dehydrogenase
MELSRHLISLPQLKIASQMPFATFIQNFKSRLEAVFHQRTTHDQLGTQRGMPPYVMREILSADPLLAFIPESHGGRGAHVHEGIEVVSAASYESLALGLTLGINWGLFLQPVAKYGNEAIKDEIFKGFVTDKKMGGLMITEPNHGSDALNMQTSFTELEEYYHLKGTKHWAGLTGWADYWLLTARRKTSGGDLMRDIEFFVSDNNLPGQGIEVEEYFENLGLYMIPYGRNKIDIRIPKLYRLEPKTNGIAMLQDSACTAAGCRFLPWLWASSNECSTKRLIIVKAGLSEPKAYLATIRCNTGFRGYNRHLPLHQPFVPIPEKMPGQEPI